MASIQKSQTVKISMETVHGMNISEECITQSVCGIRIYLLAHSNVTLALTIAPEETRESWQRKKSRMSTSSISTKL